MADAQISDDAAQDARAEKDADEQAEQEMRKLEENPPEKLEDWPGGKAKYKTFGGPEGQEGYEESATAKLGPSDLRHHEDGSVTIGGEKVDNPEDYKGEPIPGGPTDPNAPDDLGMVNTARDKDSDADASGEERDDEGRFERRQRAPGVRGQRRPATTAGAWSRSRRTSRPVRSP
jgi:hypothetical protein